MEIYLAVADDEVVAECPLLHTWLKDLVHGQGKVPGHLVDFDFDTGMYKIRPKRPPRHMEEEVHITSFGGNEMTITPESTPVPLPEEVEPIPQGEPPHPDEEPNVEPGPEPSESNLIG